MVEASLIYPMILAALLAVIYILISMYSATSVKANIHMTLRSESLLRTETGQRIETDNSFTPSDKYSVAAFNRKVRITQEKALYYSVLCGTIKHTYKGNSLLRDIYKFQEGKIYQIDEKDFIRKVDLIKT